MRPSFPGRALSPRCVTALTLSLMLASSFGAPGLQAQTAQPEASPVSDQPPPRSRTLEATRVELEPVVDGFLTDPAWQLSRSTGEFIQREPLEGKPAVASTTVKVVFTRDALFVGAELKDTAAPTIRLGRRDTNPGGDWFYVYLDPHHDRKSGAGFGVSAAGQQWDEVLFSDVSSDSSWDAVWSAAVQHDGTRWTVEMRIPFSQLRYRDEGTGVWGLQFTRTVHSRQEYSEWVFRPVKESGFVSRFGLLTGMVDIRARRSIELLPYVVPQLASLKGSLPEDPFQDPSISAGLDFKLGLSSQLTLTGSILPDFAQVEVDPAVVNLSLYETYYSEKRPFFLEGLDLFQFASSGASSSWDFGSGSPEFFYSRRIGASPHEETALAQATPILGAAKLSGRTDDSMSLAALSALTPPVYASSGDGEVLVEPTTLYSVARAVHDLGDAKGKVGGMVNVVLRDLPDAGDLALLPASALSGGMDGYVVLGERKGLIDFSLAASQVTGSEEAMAQTQNAPAHYFDRPDADYLSLEPTRTSLSGWYGGLSYNTEGAGLGANARVTAISPGFDANDLGYMRRADVVYAHAVLRYYEIDPGQHLRNWRAWMAAEGRTNFGGDVLAKGVAGNFMARFMNYWNAWAGAGLFGTTYDDRATRGGPVMLNPADWDAYAGFNSDTRKKFRVSTGTELYASQGEHPRGGVFAYFTYNVVPSLTLKFMPDAWMWQESAQYVESRVDASSSETYGVRYLFSDLEGRSATFTTRADWVLNPRLSLQTYVQPLVYVGNYRTLKALAAARSFDFIPIPDEDPDALDFSYRSLQLNAVLRWEFRPGSSLFLVWTETRETTENTSSFRPVRDLFALTGVKADDRVMFKFSYWWGA